MGAIADLLKSLSVTPVTPEKIWCNRLRAAPSVVVTQVTSVTRKKTTHKAEAAKRQVLTFTIDGTPKQITAIDMVAFSQSEALRRLRSAWGERLCRVCTLDGVLVWPSSKRFGSSTE